MIGIIQIVSLLSLLIGFSYMIVRSVADYKQDMKNNAIINANLIGEYCAVPLAFDVTANANETLEKLRNIPSIEDGIVYNDQNQIFAEFSLHGGKGKIAYPKIKYPGSYFENNYLHVFQTIMYENKFTGTIYLKVNTSELNNKINSYLLAMLALLVVILIVNYFLALGLQRIVSVPILNLTVATKKITEGGDYQLRVEKHGNDEIGVLVDEYNNMLEQIYEREESLKQSTTELYETLEDLKRAQRKLIDAEKMAALGQLIAGVAHEINTPLGAIRSSIGNIKGSLSFLIRDYPKFIYDLPVNLRELFFTLTEDSLHSQFMLTSKEERAFKKEITVLLEENNIKNAYSFADSLVDMLIYVNVEKYFDLLQSEQNEAIMHMAYKLTGLQRSTDNIDLAASRAAKVVFALKNYARIGNADEKVLSSISDGIETVLTLYYNQIKQGVEVTKIFDDVPKILCYPDELNQVWTNILHNAIYAMELKGNLDIRIIEQGNYIVVSITDSGGGIPKEIQDEIFKPFFSTKPSGEGSGMGLDIVKRIIEKHNGKIDVESKPGKTSFRVFLPIDGESVIPDQLN
jgi:signal transduction histidine kinase